MTFDMENQIGTLAYEQPTLKKYGNMKKLTFAAGGSSPNGVIPPVNMGKQGGDHNNPNMSRIELEPDEWHV